MLRQLQTMRAAITTDVTPNEAAAKRLTLLQEDRDLTIRHEWLWLHSRCHTPDEILQNGAPRCHARRSRCGTVMRDGSSKKSSRILRASTKVAEV